MNTLELIKDSCLFGGTVPNERIEEVRTFLDNLEKQLTIPVVMPMLLCLNDEYASLTKGNKYTLINDEATGYLILDDNGIKGRYAKSRFKITLNNNLA